MTGMIALVAGGLFAQEVGTKPAEGTLTLTKKTFQLKNGVAYESSTDGEDEVAVVLSAQPISSEKLKKARDAEKNGQFGEFPQPYLKLLFKKTGELKHWSALGGGTTVGGSSDGTGELKLQDGRAVGKAAAAVDAIALIPKGFNSAIRVPVLLIDLGRCVGDQKMAIPSSS